MKAVLAAAGTLRSHSAWFRRQCRDAALLIAVDGGLAHFLAHDLEPHLLVGDLDSVSEDQRKWAGRLETIRFPAHKDQTDLELAIAEALTRGADSLVVAGALGARHDHGITNLLMAAHLKRERGTDLCLAGDGTVVWPLAAGDEVELPVRPGDTFSLVALEPGCRLDLTGAMFGLESAPLPFGSGLGMSNVARPPTRLRMHAGLLLVMVQDERV